MFDWLYTYFSGLFDLDVMAYPIMGMFFGALFVSVYAWIRR